MTSKRNSVFLYLALACFLGIILVFIFDGYMGVYDNLTVRAGEDEQIIEAFVWERDYWATSVDWDEKIFFYYEVDNRRFSGYTADIVVSLWHSQEKISDVLVQPISVDAFDKKQVEWVVDTAEIIPDNVLPEQGYEFTVFIRRGDIVRNFVIYVRSVDPVKITPIPAR